MELFIENGKSLYTLWGVLGFGIIVKLFESIYYKRLIYHSENIESTKSKFFTSVRNKFENRYKSKEAVKNVEVFVDKYIPKAKLWGISWKSINLLLMFLGIICTVLGGIYGYTAYLRNLDAGIALENVAFGVIGGIVIFLLYYFSDVEGRKKELRVNVIDFFENNYVYKMEQIAIGQEPSTEQSKQDRKKLMASINELKKESERIENSNRRRQRLRDEQFNGENEKLLNEILQEYFS